ncbi:hypothetical protein [Pseudorhodoferax sp.]|uniref:hypothetical protein n=1 Tax=Pseudorhodoferax sp. TaxID=1993553 RepID=UPI002DD640DC|nr:hypothetical protein [Pseudorhodoferax sp.]
MPRQFIQTAAALFVAALLSACGGGEADVDEIADATKAEEAIEGVPMRGPQWLAAPSDEELTSPG